MIWIVSTSDMVHFTEVIWKYCSIFYSGHPNCPKMIKLYSLALHNFNKSTFLARKIDTFLFAEKPV